MSTTRVGWACAAMFTATVCLRLALQGMAEEPKAQPAPNKRSLHMFDRVDPQTMKRLQAKYPLESLANRLTYEAPYRQPPDAEPAEPADSKGRFRRYEPEVNMNHRAVSLGVLHGQQVDEFINRFGFGISRMAPPGPDYLESRKSEPLPFAEARPLSGDEDSFLPQTALVAMADAKNRQKNPWLLPVVEEVNDLHVDSQRLFAAPSNFGYVRSLYEVAGFVPHRFDKMPLPPVDEARTNLAGQHRSTARYRVKKEELWKLARLELVSLLKHDTPRVYVLDHLPRMEELSATTAPTRALDRFEAAALEKLRDGQEIQTSGTPNRVEMLGAIRATNQCAKCHEVPRGTLLGAFSYELRRDPPIKVAPAMPVVQ